MLKDTKITEMNILEAKGRKAKRDKAMESFKGKELHV